MRIGSGLLVWNQWFKRACRWSHNNKFITAGQSKRRTREGRTQRGEMKATLIIGLAVLAVLVAEVVLVRVFLAFCSQHNM